MYRLQYFRAIGFMYTILRFWVSTYTFSDYSNVIFEADLVFFSCREMLFYVDSEMGQL